MPSLLPSAYRIYDKMISNIFELTSVDDDKRFVSVVWDVYEALLTWCYVEESFHLFEWNRMLPIVNNEPFTKFWEVNMTSE